MTVDKELLLTLSQRLDQALRERKASEVALQVGVTPTTLSAWRNGRRQPKTDQLLRLCLVLGVSSDWLLGQSDVAKPRPDGPTALVRATLDDLEDEVEEVDSKRLLHALLNALQDAERLRSELDGARKRNRIDVENALRDLQRNVIRGLLRAMDAAEISPEARERILAAMNEAAGEGVRERVSG